MEEGDDITSNEGFSACDTEFGDTESDECAGDGIEFFEREDVMFRQEGDIFGHAVGASEVASVGDGESEV